MFVHCDVSDSKSAAEAFDRIAGHFGGVDVLVNNAGIQRYSSVTETTDEEWDLVIGVNLTGVWNTGRVAIPSMIEHDQGGSIGKRYRRQDEIGTPFGVTIDHQTMEDDSVTLRDRDSLEQVRLPVEGLVEEIAGRLAAPWTSPKPDPRSAG